MRKTSTLARAVTGAVTSAVVVLGLAPTVSAAEPLRCGDTVTTDVVLTENLTCSGDGLVVAEAGQGVTIDLNGHRLRGDGTGIGITVQAQQVTITGGRIEGFRIGVFAEEFSPQLEVTDATFVRNGIGLQHFYFVTVTGSSFRDNGRGVECGTADLLVSGSRFTDNQQGIDADLCGVTVLATSFTGGQVALNTEESEVFGVIIRNSSFKGAGVGVHVTNALDGPRVIADNTFTGNGASGLVIERDTPYVSPGIQVSGNLFKSNGFDPGSHVDPSGNPLTSGVWANDGAFARNQAIGNAGHGIEAYGVATDDGGNVARRNGAEPQCIGVVCTPR